jgi:hypothetical protein
LTPVALRVSDAPVPNFILNSNIWHENDGASIKEKFYDKEGVLLTLKSCGLKFKCLEYLMFMLREYNNGGCRSNLSGGSVTFTFSSLKKFFGFKSRYDFRLASSIADDMKSLMGVNLSVHYPADDSVEKSIIRLYAEKLYRTFSMGKDKDYVGYNADEIDEPLITEVSFDRDRREYTVIFNRAFIGLMEGGVVRYKHIDLKSYVSISSVQTKNIYRYFDTKYDLIRVKRSTLINQAGVNSDQEEKSLNYKMKKYFSVLVGENVITLISYDTSGGRKIDPLITVDVTPKKRRTLELDKCNKRHNGNYIVDNRSGIMNVMNVT